MDLKSCKVLVTGGGSGMGRAFTLSLARDGADVAFCDVNEDAIAAVMAEGAELPGKVVGFKANVADEAEVTALIARSAEALGGLNGLVNNAGIFRDAMLVRPDKKTGGLRKMSLADWNAVIAVDLTGPFLCTREFAAYCIENNVPSSCVVSISSISRHGNAGQTNYSAAKAGLIADTALWAKELSRYGMRFGAVAPGFIDTPILQGMRPEMLEQMLSGVPMRRVGSPHEIYQAVKFIFECDYFTGRCVDVDGGLTL
jgi:3-oxoacyl-[acyl-carrier protein] reductase